MAGERAADHPAHERPQDDFLRAKTYSASYASSSQADDGGLGATQHIGDPTDWRRQSGAGENAVPQVGDLVRSLSLPGDRFRDPHDHSTRQRRSYR